ncbi:MAG: integral rane protein MviN, partial [Edaphobacter sp.]|nr:integral rane protein MviN [Edaphobacter sp.]
LPHPLNRLPKCPPKNKWTLRRSVLIPKPEHRPLVNRGGPRAYVPSAIGFIVLGDVIVATVYRSGHFRADDVTFVWSVLAGSGVGLLASTSGRLYSSAFYALRDTRTPLKFALIRVSLTLILGYLFALQLPKLLNIDHRWGVAGLTLSAGLAGRIEFALLRHSLHQRIGPIPSHSARITRLWFGAFLASGFAYGLKLILPFHSPILVGVCVLSTYGIGYILAIRALGIPLPGSINRLFSRP